MNKNTASKFDPDVKLPGVVQRQIDAANAAFAAQNTAAAPAEAPAEEPATEVTQEGNTPLADTGFTTDQPAQQPSDAADGDGNWEHKYRSLHGRYMVQTNQITTLTDEVRNLQNVIASMSAVAPVAQMQQISTERLVTEEEAADYGTDFLNVVGRQARQEIAPILSQIQQRLDGLSGAQAQTVRLTLNQTLDSALPSWRKINEDPNFISWLGLPDPYSGAIRMDMLRTAHSQGNANRVLAFFNGFLDEGAAVAPAGQKEPVVPAPAPKVSLQTLAAPGRAKAAAATPAPEEKPVITRADIASFYANVAAGNYRGKDALKAQHEEFIFSAQREGRIAP